MNHTHDVNTSDYLAALPQKAKVLCNRMLYDIKVSKDLEKSYPNVILSTHYETLSSEPNATVSAIYDFLGMKPPQDVVENVWAHAHNTHNNGAIGTKRKNATNTAHAWRTQLSREVIQVISEQCGQLLQVAGYDH